MTGIIIHDLVKVMLAIDPSGSNKKWCLKNSPTLKAHYG